MKNGGYELVLAPQGYPGMCYQGKYCYEHHLVWWQNTGKLPGHGEVIHHKNGDKRDNRFENLERSRLSEHTAHHNRQGGRVMVRIRCPACSKVFVRPRNQTHLGIAVKAATLCSRKCMGGFSGRSRHRTAKQRKLIAASVVAVFRLFPDGAEESMLRS